MPVLSCRAVSHDSYPSGQADPIVFNSRRSLRDPASGVSGRFIAERLQLAAEPCSLVGMFCRDVVRLAVPAQLIEGGFCGIKLAAARRIEGRFVSDDIAELERFVAHGLVLAGHSRHIVKILMRRS